jgi:hypothetical protein
METEKLGRNREGTEVRKNGWVQITGTNIACCLVNGEFLCGRPSNRPYTIIKFTNDHFGSGLKNCPECDEKNDGLWFFDA